MLRSFALAAVTLAACADKEPVPKADLAAERFTTRGKVTGIEGRTVDIFHEHIAKLRLADGAYGEMPPMTMTFSATDAAPIRGVAVGDAVKIEFTTHYQQPPRLRLISIEKLPAGTTLALPE